MQDFKLKKKSPRKNLTESKTAVVGIKESKLIVHTALTQILYIKFCKDQF